MKSWIRPGALVRLHPLDGTGEGRVVRVYDITDTGLVHIGAVKGQTAHAIVDDTLIDVPVKDQR